MPQAKKKKTPEAEKRAEEEHEQVKKNEEPSAETQTEEKKEADQPNESPDQPVESPDQPSEQPDQPNEQPSPEEEPQKDESPSQPQPVAPEQMITNREAQVRDHNERSGGGEVREGELQEQLDLHNRRTAGVIG